MANGPALTRVTLNGMALLPLFRSWGWSGRLQATAGGHHTYLAMHAGLRVCAQDGCYAGRLACRPCLIVSSGNNMKTMYRYFFRGLITFLPVALTVYLLYLFIAGAESMAVWLIRPLFGAFYLPGLGLLFGVGLILVLGFLVSQPLAARLLSWVELPFTRLPVVKSIYSSLKNFADYFSPHDNKPQQQVVLLRMPDHDLAIVGLVTRQSMAGLPSPLADQERVAVYLPMGYMIGGYTVFVPRGWTETLDMTVEEAMRSSLIAWMPSSRAATDVAAPPADAP